VEIEVVLGAFLECFVSRLRKLVRLQFFVPLCQRAQPLILLLPCLAG
jgi:hypothetical protein